MNHKRGRSKDRRAGCLLCKPWKSNATKDTRDAIRPSERRRLDRLGPKLMAQTMLEIEEAEYDAICEQEEDTYEGDGDLSHFLDEERARFEKSRSIADMFAE